MAGTDLKIDDDYVKGMGTKISAWTLDMQDAITAYLGILDKILDDSIVEGDTATAIASFKTYAEGLNSKLSDLGTDICTTCNNFIKDVDINDQYLF